MINQPYVIAKQGASVLKNSINAWVKESLPSKGYLFTKITEIESYSNRLTSSFCKKNKDTGPEKLNDLTKATQLGKGWCL